MASQRNSFLNSNAAVLLWVANLLLAGWFPSAISGNESDRQALLAIKSEIDDDPFGVTSSWNNSMPLCQWKGITCGRKHQRVTELDLSHQHLRATLSPHVGNLSFLRFINLGDNKFYGAITPEIGRLSRLESLILDNNTFGGTIPANLTYCSNLVQFFANRNNLVGNIPAELGNLLKLEILQIAFNNLTGQLPSSLGNLSALRDMVFKQNKLQGSLPDMFGSLKRLVRLWLSFNKFIGLVPPSVYNISSLETLVLVSNQLSGSLPVHIGTNLPNLVAFDVGINNLSGTLPESLSNASKLEVFDVSINYFSGKVSINFQQAKSFSQLNIEGNNLGTGGAGDLDFLTTLTNCSILESIAIDDNQFGGPLPNSITNLSTTLIYLYLGRNQITGTIPSGIANLTNLIGIGMELNQLNGTIPDSLGELQNLQGVGFGANALTGKIPSSVGNLSRLYKIGLEYNFLEGSIPAEFGNCQNLVMINLISNRLTGPVPKEIFTIVTLSTYLVSNNNLTGSFPSEVGNLKTLVLLHMSENNFSGLIPSAIGSCSSLEVLYLEKNNFYGNIPATLSSLRSLVELDLSNNNLSGQIREGLEKLSFLKYLNLSYNQFEGQVPTKGVFGNTTATVLTGNKGLCGGIAKLHLPLCHFNKIKEQKRTVPFKLILIVSGVLGVLLLLSSLLLCFCWLRKKGVRGEPSLSAFRLGNSLLMVSFQQLLKATDGFSLDNLIGQGSFGRVYRGILDQNQEKTIIAVKVMNLEKQGASKSFITECKTLRSVRHRNLVKIISACSSIDFQGNPFKALIYEYMPNGSLERWLHAPSETNAISHEEGEPVILNFPQRLNVAIDVASALDYLHHQCEVPVVHCDLKPSNILLDHEMVAHVGDFGLARFFPNSMNNSSGNSTITVGLKGTVGYAAPEYGIGSEATTSGDMYSYGILLLEMFTGKRPTNDMFKDGITLHHFTKMALHDQVLEVVDPLLLSVNNEEENASKIRSSRTTEMQATKLKECRISILRVGICCSVESPNDRMDIVDASRELLSIRNKFVGTRIQTQA